MSQQQSSMAAKPTILSIPYEIREQIWRLADTKMPNHINYCNLPSTPSTPKKACIRKWSEILETLDPLHVVRHASQLAFPGTTYQFCSTYCLFDAMHVSTEHQRNLMAQGRFYIPFSEADTNHILSAPDAAPGSIMLQKGVGGLLRKGRHEESGDDGEGRVGDIMAEMFRLMGNVGWYFFNTDAILIGHWSGKNGGRGWVELIY